MGFNLWFKGLKTQYVPRSKHISFIKTNQLKPISLCYMEQKVAVCSEINIKHIKCGQNIQFLNVKPVGA